MLGSSMAQIALIDCVAIFRVIRETVALPRGAVIDVYATFQHVPRYRDDSFLCHHSFSLWRLRVAVNPPRLAIRAFASAT